MQVEHVERPIDNCVQVFISRLVAAIVHSNYTSVTQGMFGVSLSLHKTFAMCMRIIPCGIIDLGHIII